MAANVNFISGAYNGVYEYKNGDQFIKPGWRAKSLRVADIAGVDFQGGLSNTASTGRGVAGALVGGMAFGGAGMIAGAVLGNQKMEAPVVFYFVDGTKAFGYCNGPMLQELQKMIFEERFIQGRPENFDQLAESSKMTGKPKKSGIGQFFGKLIALSFLGVAVLIVIAVIASAFK